MKPQCHIVPLEWSATCDELIQLWRRWESRGQLIDLETALAYFRPTAMTIDITGPVEVIGPPEPYPYGGTV